MSVWHSDDRVVCRLLHDLFCLGRSDDPARILSIALSFVSLFYPFPPQKSTVFLCRCRFVTSLPYCPMARVFRFLKCNVPGFFILAKQGALFHGKIAFPSGVVSLRTGHLAFYFSLIFLLLRTVYAFHPPFHCHLFSPAALSLLVNPISRFLFPLPKSAILVLSDPNRLSSFAVCPASALFSPPPYALRSLSSPRRFFRRLANPMLPSSSQGLSSFAQHPVAARVFPAFRPISFLVLAKP